ncbi:MAG TPA: sulfite reductase flavoprotein subunit alpha [Cellvibrio sp.]|nr:sulfite reductase flavoprotein subunit alpha [Cellvibrio sp.]
MKNWIYQIHWFLGITAGLVLAVVGATGALVAFEDEIMEAISPGIASVESRPEGAVVLSPDALLERFRSERPGVWVEQLTLSADPKRNAVIRTASAEKGKRGETLYVDPTTGAILGQIKGQEFFRTVLQLHRFLLIPTPEGGKGINIGRQITGFSALALVFFALSGLYLRWPRRVLHWRSWFHINFSLSGRNFYWALHSVIGTWVLIVYLLLALTGLSWSYSWYKNGLAVVLTGEAPKERQGGGGGRNREQPAIPESAPAMDAAWQAFITHSNSYYKTASFTIPRKEKEGFNVSYLLPEALHSRQRNSLSVSPAGEVSNVKPYSEDEPLGKRINQSMYELHTGEWFGMPGRIINALASALMLLFTITGFLLYFDRRKKKRSSKLAASAATGSAQATPGSSGYLIVYASQTGTAEQLAWHTASIQTSGGITPTVKSLAKTTAEDLASAEKVLLLLSTFGEGEAPDSARGAIKKLMKSQPQLQHLQFAILALGDRRYRDYCAFALQVESWLLGTGARQLFARIEVDNGDEHAIQQWQQQIASLSGVTTISEWSAPEYEPWVLHSRSLLNQGSVGAAIYSVALVPEHIGKTQWQAGDILEIKPQNNPALVEKFISEHRLDSQQIINGLSLKEWLAKSIFPSAQQLAGKNGQDWVAGLEPLPHREYSIASLPTDGKVELVIRQALNERGELGLGSGWLTQFASEQQIVYARIRSNPSFHAPETPAPMILIGAGTGIAGLRSHLHARRLAGQKDSWLIFGERHRAQDRLFGEELSWLASTGFLVHYHEVFSRDGDGYVQDKLIAEQQLLLEWLARGATIYVCGSLTGVGAGVEAALLDILGEDELQVLREAGRYRRDIY